MTLFIHLLLSFSPLSHLPQFDLSLTFLYSCDDGGKVVIQQDHVGGLFGHV